MAGNKNPWRDIATADEWEAINLLAPIPVPRPLPPPPVLPPPVVLPPLPAPPQVQGRQMGGHRAAAHMAQQVAQLPLPAAPRRQFNAGAHRAVAPTVDQLAAMITDYHSIQKDDHRMFLQRAAKLNRIARQAELWVNEYRQAYAEGAKDPLNGGRKQLGDALDVWTRSLAHRAGKKSSYLTNMARWHESAKAKYTDRVLMSAYLRGLAEGGNVKDGGEKLHTTPYATIEKIDPYHRQTFVFLDPDDLRAQDQDANLMGAAFLQYLKGPAPVGSQNPNPSFYEWLEYHEFCLGTPNAYGEDRFKDPPRISYDGHDLTHVRVGQSRMTAEQVISAPGVWDTLDTSNLPPSGKGPPNAAAFVWDSECHLWLHAHGQDEFIHASAKQGRKIRCSGMMVVTNGVTTYISNESGHYAPTALNIFHFTQWLRVRRCVKVDAVIDIHHGQPPVDGLFYIPDFLQACRAQGMVTPGALPYPV